MTSEEARWETRAQLAQEVLELGEELFELALGQQSKAVDNKETDAEAEELREAKEEFFTALRLLLSEVPKDAIS